MGVFLLFSIQLFSMKNYNIKYFLITIVLLIVFILGYFWIKNYQVFKEVNTGEGDSNLEENPVKGVGDPNFKWVFDYKDDNLDFPKTVISLTAEYEDGVILTKEIDTAQGSCNQYDKKDKDVYGKSEMAICYFAGYGHYYKIVKLDDSYLIQRRIFEEASPDYSPQVLPFETISEF